MNALIALYIILAIILLVFLLSFLRIHFDILCNEELSAAFRIFCIRIPLYPKNKKRVSVKKFKKGYPKTKDKKVTPPETKKEKSKKSDIPFDEKISTILSLIKLLFSRFFRHLRLDVSKIIIIVGGSDAATAAITHGIISQSVAYLLEFLDSHMKISKKRKGEINVLCDFTDESIKYDISISASLSLWQIIDIGVSLAYNYFKGKDIFNLLNSK